MRKLEKAYQQTFRAKDFGYDDEKRLQREFNSKAIKLRWNQITRRCEVWYDEGDQLYIIYDILAPYNICRAIKSMKARERSMKEVQREYYEGQALEEERKRKNIRSMAEEVAKSLENAVNNKISIRV